MENRLGLLDGAGERQTGDATGSEDGPSEALGLWDGFWGVSLGTVFLLVFSGALG